MEEYALHVKLKNNLILQRIYDAGYRTPMEFFQFNNLEPGKTYELINLRSKAMTFSGTWTKAAQNLADALGCDPDDLFTEQQRITSLPTNAAVVPIAESVLRLASDPMELLERQDLAQRILEMAKEHLSFRANKIIEMRYLEGKTLEDCANEFGIGRERVRQVEVKGLRKMRELALKNRHILGVGKDQPAEDGGG